MLLTAVYIPLLFFLYFVIRYAVAPRALNHVRRPAIDKKRPEVNYYKIGRLEIELFGETKPNVDSYVKPYQKNEYGITADGHIDDVCNVNASMGPVCRNKWHTGRRVQPSPGQGMADVFKSAINGYGPPVDPYGDRDYNDPTWTDEDGRPW